MVPTKKRNTQREARQHNTDESQSKGKGECKLPPENSIDIADEVPKNQAPLWFLLLPARDKNGNRFHENLKPILRIKDYNTTVSTIQKYLNIEDESEGEISCFGKNLNPTMNVYGIEKLWLECFLPNGLEGMRKQWAAEELIIELAYSRHIS